MSGIQKIASAVLLPISDAILQNVTISADGNCIGRFNETALDPNCYEDRQSCLKWQTSGALGGYITLEDADTVKIRELNFKSLCAFLSGETTLTCGRDPSGKILYQGDYCGATKQPGGCADSVWLAATFAASATKIFDGAGQVPACSGAISDTDAGADAAADAAADASDDAPDGD